MKEQLKTLAQTDQQSFHVHLRERVGKKATTILENKLKDIIVLMPDLVSRIFLHWNKSENHSKVKKMGGYILAYLYTPEDFLSTSEWGLFGYLDDAYFAAKMYTQVIDEIKASGGKIVGIDFKYYDQAKYLKKYVRGVIPKETQKIDKMIFGLKDDKSKIYEDIFN